MCTIGRGSNSVVECRLSTGENYGNRVWRGGNSKFGPSLSAVVAVYSVFSFISAKREIGFPVYFILVFQLTIETCPVETQCDVNFYDTFVQNPETSENFIHSQYKTPANQMIYIYKKKKRKPHMYGNTVVFLYFITMNCSGYAAHQTVFGQYNVNMNYRLIPKKTYFAMMICGVKVILNSVFVEICLNVLIEYWNETTENPYFNRNVSTDK